MCGVEDQRSWMEIGTNVAPLGINMQTELLRELERQKEVLPKCRESGEGTDRRQKS
jgi:hypothetical protein